jgi:uncharacterized oxidoreductase
MKRYSAERLKTLVAALFAGVGCRDDEAARIAHYLVESNLAGHDSHGVIRAPTYVDWARRDMVRPNQTMQVVCQTEALAIVDGQFGFGQTIGEQAMKLGCEMARRHGVAAIALRNSGHLGRIGDWPMLVAKEGFASFHFVNTSGFGLLVAPFGGIDRRLSANPIAAGMPRSSQGGASGEPLILDISTCAIAEGKLKVARTRGEHVAPGNIIDREGRPTCDPGDFYGPVPGELQGALLPFGGHKGYTLSVMAEMFAGALTGNGCTNPESKQRLLNGMFSFIVDPARFPEETSYEQEMERFIAWVKSSRRLDDASEILMPGEIEARTRRDRLERGIAIEEPTWEAIAEACRGVGIETAARL